jgi:N-acetyl-beta-hexosaminidase
LARDDSIRLIVEIDTPHHHTAPLNRSLHNSLLLSTS